MLAVQLAIVKALIGAREKPQLQLVVESVRLAIGNPRPGRQVPNRIGARHVVADGIAHVSGQGAQAHHLGERNRLVARRVVAGAE